MIAPMLADSIDIKDIDRYVEDDDYLAEQKLDGHRVLVSTDGDNRPVGRTRGGALYTRGLPQHILDFRQLPDTILDGELVGAPKSRKHPTRTNEFWVFDILQMNGTFLVDQPVERRRAILEALFASQVDLPFRLVPQARTTEEKRTLIKTAVQKNLEGVIIKRIGSTYAYGARSPHWLKAKLVATADVVVMKVRDDGKESALLGVWEPESNAFREVGRCSLIGKPAVAVGSVAEIKYLYVGANGRLYQPTLMRVRTDKQPVDCTGYELKHVNKEVLEVLVRG